MNQKTSLDLSKMSPPKGSRQKKVRLGRGESSGVGKTSGRGGKGQKGRAGASIRPGFEGGQMPLYRRVPKLGFFSRKKVIGTNVYDVVSLEALNSFKDGSVVSIEELRSVGLVNKTSKAKILATGEVSRKLSIKVHAVSKAARQKIEAAGGTVEILA